MITRRDFLEDSALALAALALPLRGARADAFKLPEGTLAALESSRYVYVSPLRADGAESHCHAEVWFFWDQGAVVCGVGSGGWKAQALERGLDRARLWVGDFGQGQSGPEGPFRKGPGFEARATRDTDPASFERLLAAFGKRYPGEWGKWEPRFRRGWADGSRLLVRYTPIAA